MSPPQYTTSQYLARPETLFKTRDRNTVAHNRYVRFAQLARDAETKGLILPVSYPDLMHGLYVAKKRRNKVTWREYYHKLQIAVLYVPSVLKQDPLDASKMVLNPNHTHPRYLIDHDLPVMAIHPKYQPDFKRYERSDRGAESTLTLGEQEAIFYMIRANELSDVAHARASNGVNPDCIRDINTEHSKMIFNKAFKNGYPSSTDKSTFGCSDPHAQCQLEPYLAFWAVLKLHGVEIMANRMVRPEDRDDHIAMFFKYQHWSFQDWINFIGAHYVPEKAKEATVYVWKRWIKKNKGFPKDVVDVFEVPTLAEFNALAADSREQDVEAAAQHQRGSHLAVEPDTDDDDDTSNSDPDSSSDDDDDAAGGEVEMAI